MLLPLAVQTLAIYSKRAKIRPRGYIVSPRLETSKERVGIWWENKEIAPGLEARISYCFKASELALDEWMLRSTYPVFQDLQTQNYHWILKEL